MKADRPNDEDDPSQAAQHFAELLARAAVKQSQGHAHEQPKREPDGA